MKLPLRWFKPRQNAEGVAVTLDKRAGPQTVAHAFGPKIRLLGRGVWRRTSKKRSPIQKLFDVDVIGGDTGALYASWERAGMADEVTAEAGDYFARRAEQRLKLRF